MTSKLTRLTDDELTETLRQATSGYPLPASVEGNLRHAFAELQERRKAEKDSNPVGWTDEAELRDVEKDGCGYLFKANPITPHADPRRVIPLYRHAQPAPVVPNGLRLALSNAGIAAPESDEMLAATCEKHIQALVTWVKDRKPFQSAPVVPSFEEWLSAANRKPLGWVKDAMREAYDAFRAAMLQAGNSPAIPDGYVMVPKEPTQAMCAAFNDSDYGRKSLRERYVAMLAAAQQPQDEPQNIPEIIPGWIPVSERMPDDDDFVYIWPRPDFGVELHVGQYCECSPKGDGWYAQVYEQNYGIEWYPITVTHWMPLPAAPQEVKSES